MQFFMKSTTGISHSELMLEARGLCPVLWVDLIDKVDHPWKNLQSFNTCTSLYTTTIIHQFLVYNSFCIPSTPNCTSLIPCDFDTGLQISEHLFIKPFFRRLLYFPTNHKTWVKISVDIWVNHLVANKTPSWWSLTPKVDLLSLCSLEIQTLCT